LRNNSTTPSIKVQAASTAGWTSSTQSLIFSAARAKSSRPYGSHGG
jgi:hypothetical protein